MSQKVLVVEDDDILREAYLTKLTMEGYEVKGAADGREAEDLAKTFRPNAVLLDILLPKKSGLDVLKVIKAEQPETKVLAFSNMSVPEVMKEAIDLGAEKFLQKSTVTPNEIVTLIKEYLTPQEGPPPAAGIK